MSLWTPSQFASRVGWWDASAITGLNNNDPVSTWLDLSPSGWNAMSTGTNRPTYITNNLNSLPVIRFSGTNHLGLGNINLFRNVSGGTIYAVMRDNAPTARNDLINIAAPGGLTRLAVIAGSFGVGNADKFHTGGRRLDTDSYSGINSTITTTSSWALVGSVASWATDTLTLFVDAVQAAQNTSWQTANSGQNTSNTATEALSTAIGASNTSNTNGFNGEIAEIVITHSALSTANRQLLEGYLAWKWGLQANLPSDHPFRAGAPTVGAQRRVINDGLFNRGLFGRSLVR